MDIQDKTKEELQKELSELQQAHNAIKVSTEADSIAQKQAEKELLKSREMLKSIEKSAKIGGWEFDVKTMVQTWTEETFHILEIDTTHGTPDVPEGVGFIAPEFQPKALLGIQRAIEFGEPYNQEWEVITAKGNKRWVNAIATPYQENGKTKSVSGSFQDITKRKLAEIALLVSEETLSTTLHSIGDAVISTDKNGLVVNMNPVAETLCGWQLSEASGKHLSEVFNIINAETRHTVADPVKKVLENGEIVGLANHTILVSKNGAEYQIADSAAPIKTKEGEITGVVLVFSDITETYTAQKQIKDSEEQYRLLFQNLTAGFALHEIILNAEGKPCDYRFLEINPAFETLTGLKAIDLIGKTEMEILPDTEPYWIETYGEVALKGNTISFENYSRELNKHYQVSAYSPEPGKFATVFLDITELKQADEKFRLAKERAEEFENKFKQIAENIDEVFWLRTDSEMIYVSPSFEKIWGIPCQAIYENLQLFTEKIHPEDKPVVQKIFQSDEFKVKSLLNFEYRIIRADNQIRWINAKTVPIVDDSGKIIKRVGIASDITEKYQTIQELIHAKNRAEESDKLKSAFLANMSHEIRTPMNGILGFTELLLEPDLSSEQKESFIKIIHKSGQRLLNTVNDIVEISKIEAGLVQLNLTETDVNGRMEELIRFFQPEADKKGLKLSLEMLLPEADKNISTDQSKLNSILTNLIKNAIKYTDTGSIQMGCRRKSTVVEFYVKDTGIGVPKDKQKAIFERFIQADIADKRAFQGSGLGLAISKAYVEMLGGKIWVESEEGIGSTFYFTLPYSNVQEEKKVVPAQVKEIQIENLKILIVEDDETSEMLIAIGVEKFGKEILKARNGFEAVEVCRNNPDTDLILMDVQMPVMNGYEATRRIREFNKEVIIIAQTALGLLGDRKKAIESGCNDYITKPIKKDELLSLIQKYFGK